jgi:hypothetical protein
VLAGLWLAPVSHAAGWCGSGESAVDRPDIVTGPQIHAVVATPSDGPDLFATDAGRIADDVNSVVAWWQGQDPTRVPRFDQASFAGVSCLDVSFVRLTGTGAAYAAGGASTAFSTIFNELAGTANSGKIYLVYYEGPAPQANVCGTGGTRGFGIGPALALVWLQGCPDVPNDTIAAHELLHALGALPPGAPHACPGDAGHPCDSDTDILYPYTTGLPLSSLVLDFNHDDYYAHSGSWNDIQDSVWLHRLDLPAVALNVSLTGTGEIRSDVPGVDCTAACSTQWDQGSPVVLIAQPAPGERFIHWSGSCTGNGDCTLELDQPATAAALFGPVRIPLKVTHLGKGAVKCTPACTRTFPGGSALKLRAVPAKGWKFAGWSGGCKGTRLTCSPGTDFALSVRATFRRR